MENTLIKIENLEKTYKSRDGNIKYPILKGIDLTINKSDLCIIYGPSGSGKSTLLHHIIGLEKPTKGNIFIQGQNIATITDEERSIFRSKNFGIVYQMWYWIKSLTVLENVAMPLYVEGFAKDKAFKRAMACLEEVGMQDYALKSPVQLSGGEQQKALLARALVNNPLIIVADEPTGNLDTHSSDQIMQLLQNLNVNEKRTIIMVTHNLIYLPMASKKVAIKDGLVISSDAQGVANEIRTELQGVF